MAQALPMADPHARQNRPIADPHSLPATTADLAASLFGRKSLEYNRFEPLNALGFRLSDCRSSSRFIFFLTLPAERARRPIEVDSSRGSPAFRRFECFESGSNRGNRGEIAALDIPTRRL
jgi:hypothetical protein